MPTNLYGKIWPDGAGKLEIELMAFKLGLSPETGGLGKFQHFKNVVETLWPYHKTRNKSGFCWHPWAERMIQAACEQDYLAVSGPKSSGKTAAFAMWGLVNWLCAPHETLVLVTSTSIREARKRLWGGIRERFLQVPGFPGKLIDSMGKIILTEGDSSDRSSITLVPSSPDKEKEATAKLIGLKNQRVFLIIDEATDVTNSVFEAISNLNSNPTFQCIALGNFASQYDPFGMFAAPVGGWNSVTVDKEEWKTKLGLCLHLDGTKTPNVEHDDAWPFLLTTKQLKHAEDHDGEHSISFWRFIRSFPAPGGAEASIYSEADFRKFEVDKAPKWIEPPKVVAGLDPSFTNGGDRTVLYFLEYGRTEEAGPTVNFKEFTIIRENVNDPQPRNFQVAKQVMTECQKHGVPPEYLAVDATGAGDPLCDIISELWSPRILRVKFGERPSTLPISSTSMVESKDKYSNKVTELWFGGVEFMRSGQLKGVVPELARELTSRRYTTMAGGKLVVETKRDYKSRIGKSPDLADAAFVGLECVRLRVGAMAGGTVMARKSGGWQEQARRLDRVIDTNKDPVLNY